MRSVIYFLGSVPNLWRLVIYVMKSVRNLWVFSFFFLLRKIYMRYRIHNNELLEAFIEVYRRIQWRVACYE